MPVKCLASDGHLNLVKRVLHDIVRIELVNPAEDDIDIGLLRLRKEEELGASQGLEALHPKVFTLHNLQARGWHATSRRTEG